MRLSAISKTSTAVPAISAFCFPSCKKDTFITPGDIQGVGGDYSGFDVLEDGKTKKVAVTFNVYKPPVNNAYTKLINFEVQVNQISVDRETVTTAPVHFNFIQCKNLSAK